MKYKALSLALAILAVASCSNKDDDKNTATDNWSKYTEWRNTNIAWFDNQSDSLDDEGRPFYHTLYPGWNPGAEVLIHYFNDRSETEGRLSPMLTSTCDIIYRGHLYNDVPFDSSYLNKQYGPAIMRCRPADMISGFAIALMDMRVGDSCQVAIPYPLGYGGRATANIPPFSTLVFNIGLRDIAYYEIPD